MYKFLAIASAFVAAVSALSVTSPTDGQVFLTTDNIKVSWAAVSSDSQPFNVIVAISTDANNGKTVATNILPSADGVTIKASDFTPGNYSINLMAFAATSSGILAQSKTFTIKQGAVVSSSSSASVVSTSGSTPSSTAATGASGTTLTTVVSSSGSSGTGTATVVSTSATGTVSSSSTDSTATSTATNGTAASVTSASPSATTTKSGAAGNQLSFSLIGMTVVGAAFALLA